MSFHLRAAGEADIPALAALHVQTFDETHRAGRRGRVPRRGSENGGHVASRPRECFLLSPSCSCATPGRRQRRAPRLAELPGARLDDLTHDLRGHDGRDGVGAGGSGTVPKSAPPAGRATGPRARSHAPSSCPGRLARRPLWFRGQSAAASGGCTGSRITGLLKTRPNASYPRRISSQCATRVSTGADFIGGLPKAASTPAEVISLPGCDFEAACRQRARAGLVGIVNAESAVLNNVRRVS
jgi:hypothetical protein